MADRLTQLQDCYDQLATQFYASIRYISLHHSASALPAPPPLQNANANSNHIPDQPLPAPEQPDPSSLPSEQRPDTPTSFAAAQRELAQDLITKTKQIEYLISVLPGVEKSQEVQEGRIRDLDGELRRVLRERESAERERSVVVGMVEGVIGGVRR